MKIETTASLKGGVGKTTISINRARCRADRGEAVLLVDADPNNNATDYTLKDIEDDRIDAANLFHVLTEGRPVEECIYQSWAGFDVLPSTVRLMRFSVEAAMRPELMQTFRSDLSRAGYDRIIIDSAPYASAEMKAAVWASDVILCPVAPKRWTLQAMYELQDVIDTGARITSRKPSLLLVPSQIRKSMKHAERLEMLRDDGYAFLQTEINHNDALDEANEMYTLIRRGSRAHQEFEKLEDEIEESYAPQHSESFAAR